MFKFVAITVLAAVAIVFVGVSYGVGPAVLAWIGFSAILMVFIFLGREQSKSKGRPFGAAPMSSRNPPD